MAINDSSDVLSFDLYFLNIFKKSTNAERCTDVMFKMARYYFSVTIKDLNF